MVIYAEASNLLEHASPIRCNMVNFYGTMDHGLSREVSIKYPEAFQPYQEMCKQFGERLFGEVQFVPCHDGTTIANLFTQAKNEQGEVTTDTLALEECLERLLVFAMKTETNVCIPSDIGCVNDDKTLEDGRALVEKYFSAYPITCTLIDHKGLSKSPRVNIYIGSDYQHDTQTGGWSAILSNERVPRDKELCGTEKAVSKNRMELTAAIKALEALKCPCKVSLYTSSAYLPDVCNQRWLNGQEKSEDLLSKLSALLDIHDVTVYHVKSKEENPRLDKCTELATTSAMQSNVSEISPDSSEKMAS